MRAHPFVCAYVVALAPALLMALTQPIWSLVDEAQHFDFIVQLSHGVYPAADQTPIDPETLAISRTTGAYRAFYPPGSYPPPDLADLGPIPPGLSQRADAAWMVRHAWQLSHESLQTPGYYVLMVPFYALADRIGGALMAVYVLRIVNALVIAALAPLAYALGRMLWADRPMVAVIAAGIVIFLPGLQLNGTRISNDALAALLGALLLYLAARAAGSTLSWRFAVGAGAIAGLALLVKLTLVGLIPAIVVALLWPSAQMTLSKRLARVAAMVGVAAASLVPWFLINLHIYGGLTAGARGARLADALPGQLTPALAALNVAVFHLTFWTGEPWGFFPFAVPFATLGLLLVLMALAGTFASLRRPVVRIEPGRLAVVCTAVAGMVAVSLLLPALGSFEFLAPGRYAYPAVSGLAALCGLGICLVLTRPFLQAALGVTYASVATAMLVAGVFAAAQPGITGPQSPPSDASRVAVSASGSLGDFSVRVDQFAVDRTASGVWFHVTVANSGTGPVEWPGVPIASAAGQVARGDYVHSTHFAGEVPAAGSESGWMFVPLDPAVVGRSGRITLRFADVALDSYRIVDDVNVVVDVPVA